jgi:hypothetical protein
MYAICGFTYDFVGNYDTTIGKVNFRFQKHYPAPISENRVHFVSLQKVF